MAVTTTLKYLIALVLTIGVTFGCELTCNATIVQQRVECEPIECPEGYVLKEGKGKCGYCSACVHYAQITEDCWEETEISSERLYSSTECDEGLTCNGVCETTPVVMVSGRLQPDALLAQESSLPDDLQDIPIRENDYYVESDVGESNIPVSFTSNAALKDIVVINSKNNATEHRPNRTRRDALSNGDYEEYYKDGDAEAKGRPRPRRPSTEEITTSIEWQVQLFLLLAVVVKITCWVWLYCLMYPLAECSGYWLDRCRRRDPRYRIIKQLGQTLHYDVPNYKEWLPIVRDYDLNRTMKFDVLDFFRFMHCQITARIKNGAL